MSWREAFATAIKIVIAFIGMYVAGTIILLLGVILVRESINNYLLVPGAGMEGNISPIGLTVGIVLLVAGVIASILGFITIAIKILTKSVTDNVIRRMRSEGMK